MDQKKKQSNKGVKMQIKETLKGLSHEIDFKNFDQTLKNLT